MRQFQTKILIILWIPTHGQTNSGRPAKLKINQLSADTECRLENLPRTLTGREGWRESREFMQSALFGDDDDDDEEEEEEEEEN